MKYLLNIIKKHIFGIFIIIGLLVLQAVCDLKLPEYTSNIINVGIQQHGLTDNTLKAMDESTYEVMDLLMPNTLNNYYKLINKGDKKYIEEYSSLKKNNLYVLKEISDKDLKELNKKMMLPEVIIGSLRNNKDLKGVNLKEYLINSMQNNTNNKSMNYEQMEESLLEQSAISFVVSEYKSVGYDIDSVQMSYLFSSGARMLLFTLFIALVIVSNTYLSGRIASGISYCLREKVVGKVMTYSAAEYNEFSTSSLITRSTNDIQQVQMFLTMLLRMVLYAPIVGIGALLKVIDIDISWVIAISIGLIIVLIIVLMSVAMPKFKISQKLIDRLNQVVREGLNGLPVIKAFSNEKFEKDKFNKANTDLYKLNLFINKIMSAMMPFMMLIMNGTIVLIYWVGTNSIDSGSIQIGTLSALISYTMQIIMSFLMLSALSIMGPRAIISLKRIFEVLNKEVSIQEEKDTLSFDNKVKGLIEFKDVSFKYPDGEEMVLENINFKVEPGTTLAIIGSTGSGKSSIVNLIPRFFDVTKGSILVDGVDIKKCKIKDLRDKIGVVPQKGLLFSGTIRSNLLFANPNLTDEDIKEALKISCASEFVSKYKDKYEHEISQGGTNVSGGQRQRLSIARAVAKKPEIYIFDDSFSALDYKTESIVRTNLNKYASSSTKIIVAQRVATVMNADQIIVLDQGKIVGIGNHKELYKNCKIYKEIALSQLKEEELI